MKISLPLKTGERVTRATHCPAPTLDEIAKDVAQQMGRRFALSSGSHYELRDAILAALQTVRDATLTQERDKTKEDFHKAREALDGLLRFAPEDLCAGKNLRRKPLSPRNAAIDRAKATIKLLKHYETTTHPQNP